MRIKREDSFLGWSWMASITNQDSVAVFNTYSWGFEKHTQVGIGINMPSWQWRDMTSYENQSKNNARLEAIENAICGFSQLPYGYDSYKLTPDCNLTMTYNQYKD